MWNARHISEWRPAFERALIKLVKERWDLAHELDRARKESARRANSTGRRKRQSKPILDA